MKKEKLKRSRRVIFFFLLFIPPFLFRLFFIYQFRDSPFFNHLVIDARSYDLLAKKIISGNILGDKVFYQDPLYPYFLAFLYSIFGRNLLIVRIAQATIGSISAIFIYLLGREFHEILGILSYVLYLFYGPILFYDVMIGKTNLIIFFTSLLLLLLVKERYFLSGVSLGLLSLLRGNMLVYAFLLPSSIYLLFKKDIKKALAFFFGVAIVISPVTIRNWVVGKDFVITTSQFGENFYMGNNRYATVAYPNLKNIRQVPQFEEEDFKREAQRILKKELKPSGVSFFWMKEALNYIYKHPKRTLYLWLKRVAFFINKFEIPDNYSYNFFLKKYISLKLSFLHFGIIFPFSMLASIFLLKGVRDEKMFNIRGEKVFYLLLLFLTYPLTIVPFHLTARYRFPALVPAIVLASYGIMLSSTKKGIALLVPLFIISNFPIGKRMDILSLSNAHTSCGILYAKSKDVGKAISEFKKALYLYPENANAHYNLAVLYKNMGDLEKALYEYRRVLEIDPNFIQKLSVKNSIGIIYMEKGLYTKAKDILSSILDEDPKDRNALINLGICYFKIGDTKDAKIYLERAKKLYPDDPLPYYNLCCVYASEKDYKKAKDLLLKVKSLDPRLFLKARHDPDLKDFLKRSGSLFRKP